MKILVVCQNYFPENFLINEITPMLVNAGHDVSVLTGLPNYPQGKVPKEYRFLRRRKEEINGVKVKRCFEIGRGNGALTLMLNYASFALSSSLKALFMREKFDLVLSYQLSPITMVLPAVIYKKRKKVPMFLYCLDLWPASALTVVGEGNPIYKGAAKLSQYLYAQADKIGVTSEPFIDYLHTVCKVPTEKLVYIPQHANGSLLESDLTSEEKQQKIFMFAGNLGKAQSLETVIDAAVLLKERTDFQIHLVGDGSELQNLKQKTKDAALEDKIIFPGRFKPEEMGEQYKKADVLLLTLAGDSAVGDTLPGKLQTYMTVGKPILAAINGAAVNVLADADCGKSVPAGDSEGLAGLMQQYLDDPAQFSGCGENAKTYFSENFTNEVFMNRLTNELKALVEKEES
ncbi:MAG: glycosyltransferase family 4 protein [Clostridia bacterium]|nr:glycosyltransferase family 4 protein [Clostridia bacterium]